MVPRKKFQTAFAFAVLLLFLSGLAGYFTITRLLESEKWVLHTYEIKNAVGDLDWAVLRAGRAHSGYLNSNAGDFLGQFEAAVAEIPRDLQHLQDLTRDSPQEQRLCLRLREITAERVALLRESIDARKRSANDLEQQASITRRQVPVSTEMTAITAQMREEEQTQLSIREKASYRRFVLTVITLALSLILAVIMFGVHYRFLTLELDAREAAEKNARDSEDSLRRLTGRLLQLQDAERRKFSRELHDSLGQYLVGAKMNLEMFANDGKGKFLTEAIHLLDQSIGETRTISHLLHPPLLDEVGFSSAAKWYVEGFAQRSGIDVMLDLPEDVTSLSKPVALSLFRVLQESLTNIHRHSGSIKAEIAMALSRDQVTLTVRDYGKGISAKVLETFLKRGVNSGVGLAGMRERIGELGGQLKIERCLPGALISATMPLNDEVHAASSTAGL